MAENSSASEAQISVESREGVKVPWPFYAKYFAVVSSDEKNYRIKCNLCPTYKALSCNKRTSSNLKKHLMAKHPSKIEEMESAKAKKPQPQENNQQPQENNHQPQENNHTPNISTVPQKRKIVSPETVQEDIIPSPKQIKLDETNTTVEEIEEEVTQDTVDNLILNYAIESMEPVSICDSDTPFRKLIFALNPTKTLMSARELEERISTLWESTEKQIIGNLRGIKYVATTVDYWSYCGKREFLGITAHWINPENLQRCHAVLACKWKRGSFCQEELVKVLTDTSAQYKIVYKHFGATVDSGSNFAAEFGPFEKGPQQTDAEDDADEDVKFIEIAPIFSQDKDTFQFNLPPHSQCVVHALNLIATSDIPNALLSDAKCKKLFESTLAKCKALWQKESDQVKNALGFELKSGSRKWKTTFDALRQIKAIVVRAGGIDKLNTCMDSLGLTIFYKTEIDFLKEYVEVMKTLAVPIGVIQRKSAMYQGYLLPLLYQIRSNCEKLKASMSLQYCLPLLDCVLSSLEERFAQIWTDHDHLVASCVHPKFKMDWLSDESPRKRVKEYILYEMIRRDDLQNPSREKLFFTFFEPDPQRVELEAIVDSFFEDPNRDLSIFQNDKYALVKDIFLQYNTQIPTGAGMRKTFNRDSVIEWGHAWKTDIFEKQLLLHLNNEDDHF